MIPVDADSAYFAAYPGLTKMLTDKSNKGKGTCTDDLGNSICGVYQFTITNPSPTVAQTVYGSLEVKSNNFPVVADGKTNIHYAMFKGTAAEVADKDGFAVNGTAKDVTEAAAGELVIPNTALPTSGTFNINNSDWSVTEQLLTAGGAGASQTYTIVVWLEEAGSDNVGDQGKIFNAAIKFDTSAGGSGVTGTLSGAAG